MKKIFKKYPDVVLAALALVFVVSIIAVFSWGMGDIFSSISTALNATGQSAVQPGFNLQEAQALDLRGLVK